MFVIQIPTVVVFQIPTVFVIFFMLCVIFISLVIFQVGCGISNVHLLRDALETQTKHVQFLVFERADQVRIPSIFKQADKVLK